MMSETCGLEDTVALALASGQWNGQLREHVAACAHCAELELVWQSLTQAAQKESTPLPVAGLIWWRSQLDERREKAERAVASIAIMQKLTIASALAAATASLWLWKPGVWLVLVGLGMVLATGAVLYGWVRGRI
jgi:hypothetical protein